MVKLTEVEDEHFKEKPVPTKNEVLLASDDEDDDFTDTGEWMAPFFPTILGSQDGSLFAGVPAATIARTRSDPASAERSPLNHVSTFLDFISVSRTGSRDTLHIIPLQINHPDNGS
jgi:hypothetical protein